MKNYLNKNNQKHNIDVKIDYLISKLTYFRML